MDKEGVETHGMSEGSHVHRAIRKVKRNQHES